MRIRYARRARADLAAILNYIRERSPGGARKVRQAVDKTAGLVREYPYLGRPSGEQDTRVIKIGGYPYLLYWSIEEDGVVIVHIRHAARRPWPETDESGR